VFAFPDVVHLFTDELTGLRAGGLSFSLVFFGSLQSLLFRHDLLVITCESLVITLAQLLCRITVDAGNVCKYSFHEYA
jgi:hypothetical protein